MNSVFVSQTYLRITLTSGVNVVGAQETKIQYRKPDGTIGSLDAEVTDAVSGVLQYEIPEASALLDQKGAWRFWNYIVFSDGRVARGETVSVNIYNNQQ